MSTFYVDQVRDNMPNVTFEVINTGVIRVASDLYPGQYNEGVRFFARYIDEAGDWNTINGEIWHNTNTLVRKCWNAHGCHIDENPSNVSPVLFFKELNDAAKV